MKVILQQDIKGKGKKGEMVTVSDGYARNYLIPRNLAIEANADNVNAMKIADRAKAKRVEHEREAALKQAESFKTAVVKIRAKAGSAGRLFGSVTTKEIAEALKTQFNIDIDRHKLVLDEPIKSFGTHELRAKLFPEISATVYVVVSEE